MGQRWGKTRKIVRRTGTLPVLSCNKSQRRTKCPSHRTTNSDANLRHEYRHDAAYQGGEDTARALGADSPCLERPKRVGLRTRRTAPPGSAYFADIVGHS